MSGTVRTALASDEWELIRPWVREQAAAEEHRTWLEIVKFTHRRAREIIRRNQFTLDAPWDEDASHSYSMIAAHVALPVIGVPVPLFAIRGRWLWRDIDLSPDGKRFVAVVPQVMANEQPLTAVVNWTAQMRR